MELNRYKTFSAVYQILDLIILLIALVLLLLSVSRGSPSSNVSRETGLADLTLLTIFLIGWHLFLKRIKLYSAKVLFNLLSEIWHILLALAIGIFLSLLINLFLKPENVKAPQVFFFWALVFDLMVLTRIIFMSISRFIFWAGNFHNILIIGTNQRAYKYVEHLRSEKTLHFVPLGYVDNYIYTDKPELKLLGTINDFSNIIKNTIIDEIFIFLPIKSCYDEIQAITREANKYGIPVFFDSPWFQNRKFHKNSEKQMINLSSTSKNCESFSFLFKRIIDIVMASIFLLLTFPIMLLAVVAIKLTSHGPILFVQERIGYNKRVFKMLKLRTMMNDSARLRSDLLPQNKMDGPVFKIPHDPRITKIGSFLRKTSIDELPQLFNVIAGHMSLVGPRPLAIEDFNGFSVDWHYRRFSVPPGITCIWQVNGRNNICFTKWMAMDMKYIDEWSLVNDFKILAKTIPTVLKAEGAV